MRSARLSAIFFRRAQLEVGNNDKTRRTRQAPHNGEWRRRKGREEEGREEEGRETQVEETKLRKDEEVEEVRYRTRENSKCVAVTNDVAEEVVNEVANEVVIEVVQNGISEERHFLSPSVGV